MLVLVTGGSGSGKSAFAEQRLLEFGDAARFYIATMRCRDEESFARVERHRRMRSGKGFVTVECPLRLKDLVLPRKDANVLLECLSNLAANEMFDPDGSGDAALKSVEDGIDSLRKQCDNLLVVTNEIFSDGGRYDPQMEAYLRLLGRLNCDLAAMADEVVEVTGSIPLMVKRCGAENDD